MSLASAEFTALAIQFAEKTDANITLKGICKHNKKVRSGTWWWGGYKYDPCSYCIQLYEAEVERVKRDSQLNQGSSKQRIACKFKKNGCDADFAMTKDRVPGQPYYTHVENCKYKR